MDDSYGFFWPFFSFYFLDRRRPDPSQGPCTWSYLSDLLFVVTWVWITCQFFRGAFTHAPSYGPHGPIL